VIRIDELAKVAYDAYCSCTGGVSVITGDKLPPFNAVPAAVHNAWCSAVNEVKLTLEEQQNKENSNAPKTDKKLSDKT